MSERSRQSVFEAVSQTDRRATGGKSLRSGSGSGMNERKSGGQSGKCGDLENSDEKWKEDKWEHMLRYRGKNSKGPENDEQSVAHG